MAALAQLRVAVASPGALVHPMAIPPFVRSDETRIGDSGGSGVSCGGSTHVSRFARSIQALRDLGFAGQARLEQARMGSSGQHRV